MKKNYLAFDLGASSGRAILGTLENGKMSLQELHRFANGGISYNGGIFWDILGLFNELKVGLRKALDTGEEISGIAIDTWGVDYVCLDNNGFFTSNPWNYRDSRTDNITDWTYQRVSADKIYQDTGIQFMNLNTIFQLSASIRDNDSALKNAKKILPISSALTYMFCGVPTAEYTHASTFQLFDSKKNDWAWDLIDKIGLSRDLFLPVTQPGTIVGELTTALREEMKCGAIPVILTGSHDTASAVAAVPANSNDNWAYLSSGTWSLLGVELPEPLISEKGRKANYSNEGGFCHTIRFLRNLMGLWLVQECRNEWIRRGTKYSFGELADMASEAEPFRSLIKPDDWCFGAPGDMPARIQEYCRKSGQPIPETPGQIIRTILESLALLYRQALEQLEDICNKKINVFHIIGGGTQNKLLNQFTANAIGKRVVTGPVEATAMGNILGQAMATGDIKSLWEGREIIKHSEETHEYQPQDAEAWEQAYLKFRKLFG